MNIKYSPLWTNILKTLIDGKEHTVINISRELVSSYTQTTNLIREMESKNILTIVKDGRSNVIRITQKGNELAILLDKVNKLLEEDYNG